MSGLQGVTVLVTRPAHQAAPLCVLFEAHGAEVVRFPVMQIEAYGEPAALALLVNPPAPWDLVVFTSANAVRYGAPLLDRSRSLPCAAIGPATARALEQAGLRGALTPALGFDSQGLLEHPLLAAPRGMRIAIITGRDGRDLLQTRLRQAGADVVVAAVYERRRVDYDAASLEPLAARLSGRAVDIVTATSLAIAEFVLQLSTPAMRDAFEEMHWLVPGERVAKALRDRGLGAPLIVADSAEDHDLLDAALRWRSTQSRA
jgi:uroporphyrinogen-III synthase